MCAAALCSPKAFCIDMTVHAFCVAGDLEIRGLQASRVSFPYLDVAVSLWSMGVSQSSMSVQHSDPPAERQMEELVVVLCLKAESQQRWLAERLEQRALVLGGGVC